VATDFRAVAEKYRLINQDVVNVLVPFKSKSDPDVYDKRLREATETGRMTPRAIRRWQAMAGPHSVSVYRDILQKEASQLLPISFGRSDNELGTERIDWWYLQDESSYDDRFGLRFQEQAWVV